MAFSWYCSLFLPFHIHHRPNSNSNNVSGGFQVLRVVFAPRRYLLSHFARNRLIILLRKIRKKLAQDLLLAFGLEALSEPPLVQEDVGTLITILCPPHRLAQTAAATSDNSRIPFTSHSAKIILCKAGRLEKILRRVRDERLGRKL